MAPSNLVVKARPRPRPSQNRSSGQTNNTPMSQVKVRFDSAALNDRGSSESTESENNNVRNQTGMGIVSSGISGSSSPASNSSADSSLDGLPHRPRVPKKVDDWEAMKPMIEELYLNNNVRLKDVIEVMQTLYKFRATPRMYKAQFAKWHWHKYQTSTHDGRGPRGGRSRATMVGRKGTASSLAVDLLKPNLFLDVLENDESLQLSRTIATQRSVIQWWTENDPRWNPEMSFAKMGDYDVTCCTHFTVALKMLHDKEYREGGRLLRAGFLELENQILDNHLAGVWDLCVTVPKVALNYGRKDIALTYLRYLAALAAVKKPNHPLARIMRPLLTLAELNCDIFDHYARTAWLAWTETLVKMLGKENIHPLHATRSYLCMQLKPDPYEVEKLIADYRHLVAKSTARLGPHNTEALGLEYDAMQTQWRFNLTGDDFEQSLLSVLSRVSTKEGNRDMPPVTWPKENRQVYRGCLMMSVFLYENRGDEERLATSLRMFIESPPDGDWVQMSVKIEEMFRRKGRVAEAEQISAAQAKLWLPPEMIKILEEEEELRTALVFE